MSKSWNVVRFFNNSTELNLRDFWSTSTVNSNLAFSIKRRKTKWYSLGKKKKTLRTLSQDTSIIICKPDKGIGVVVLDRKHYIKKMGTILKDKTKFQPRKGKANLENLKKFQGFLSRLKKKGVLDDSVYNQSDQLLPSLQPCTVFQKFIKTIFHWDQFSARLAVSPTNAPRGCQNL